MTFKQFLKPDWKKILVFMIVFLFLPTLRCRSVILCEPGGYCPPFIEEDISIIRALTSGCETSNISLQIWLVIPAYLIVCWIVISYGKNKESIFKFFRPKKWKNIFFLIGLLSLTVLLPNMYSVTEWVNIGLKFMRDILSTISIILFPLSLITAYLFTPIAVFISKYLVALTGLEFFDVYYYLEAAQISGSGALFVFLLLIIEWYFFSCLIVWIYDKVKKKK